ncbi:MAG: hypothetical protein IAE97_09855 [Chthoniobacterales bacterium]|nr:hypothetical protein [Chthoniobacterales bacterium]
MKPLLIALLLLASALSSHAERDIAPVYQPLSLLGTELEANPLGAEEPMAADIFATPTLVSSAYPEAIVHAIGRPHRFYNAPEGFPEESNLLVMTGGKLEAEWGEERHKITIDFSKVSIEEHLGITLQQLCDLTLLCLSKSLQQGYSDGKAFTLDWKLPSSVKLKLPSTLTISPEATAGPETP